MHIYIWPNDDGGGGNGSDNDDDDNDHEDVSNMAIYVYVIFFGRNHKCTSNSVVALHTLFLLFQR